MRSDPCRDRDLNAGGGGGGGLPERGSITLNVLPVRRPAE
jgi:hypothetical protein